MAFSSPNPSRERRVSGFVYIFLLLLFCFLPTALFAWNRLLLGIVDYWSVKRKYGGSAVGNRDIERAGWTGKWTR